MQKRKREKLQSNLFTPLLKQGYQITEISVTRFRVTNPDENLFNVLWDWATLQKKLANGD
jgi:hypothetical protein